MKKTIRVCDICEKEVTDTTCGRIVVRPPTTLAVDVGSYDVCVVHYDEIIAMLQNRKDDPSA